MSKKKFKKQDMSLVDLSLNLVKLELVKAIKTYPEFNTAHEGYAVLLEEVDELWDEVKVKQGYRDIGNLAQESIQVAAMALRFLIDICNKEKANK